MYLMLFGFETLRMNVLLIGKRKKNGNDFSCSVYLGFSPGLHRGSLISSRLHLDGMLYMLYISGFKWAFQELLTLLLVCSPFFRWWPGPSGLGCWRSLG